MSSRYPSPPVAIQIPLSPSRTPTPKPASHQAHHDNELDMPETPTRLRSDTICTTSSSSSSSAYLQTPETPSILSMLDLGGAGPSRVLESPPSVAALFGRKNSYGFGGEVRLDSPGLTTSTDIFALESGEVWDLGSPVIETAQNVAVSDESQPPFTLEPEAQLAWSDGPSITLPRPTSSAGMGPLHSSLQPLTESSAPGVVPELSPSEPPVLRRSKTSFRAAVRRKLERSKHSFQALRGARDDPPSEPLQSSSSSPLASPAVRPEPDAPQVRPQKGRLRSLLSLSKSRSRSPISTPSIRSLASATSVRTASSVQPGVLSGIGDGVPEAIVSSQLPTTLSSVVVRDFVLAPPSGVFSVPQNGMYSDNHHAPEPPIEDTSDAITLPKRNKDKGRATSPKRSSRAFIMPASSSMTITGPVRTAPPVPVPPMAVPQLRSISLPHPASMNHLPHPAITDRSTIAPKPRPELFDLMLPRELKLLVFKRLLQSYGDEHGAKLWSGEVRGRRELLKLSRVSKSWQALCLDGQLWPLVHLAPFAPHLDSATFSRIISHTQPFITFLSLRGMDNLLGTDLIRSLAFLPSPASDASRLPSLTHLDLRECKRLSSDDIVTLVVESPQLKVVNLKGVQAVSFEVVRAIARFARRLEMLDVSRCWDLTLGDIAIFVRMLAVDQAASLKALRIAGINGYGHTASDLLPAVAERLVNLEMLDIQGCSHFRSSDFKRFAETLDTCGRKSQLRHLIVSGCTGLTSITFENLIDRVPELTCLEMASMPEAFRGPVEAELALLSLLKSAPKLQRLDLEGTGAYGITDRVLETLTPGKYSEWNVVGRELVELRLGYAKQLSSEAMIRLVRGCLKLKVLELDNSAANNALMREFLRRRSDPDASLSLIDCRAITPAAYAALAPTTRARRGWSGYASLPFGYDDADPSSGVSVVGECGVQPVLKTFWSWRRVAIPSGWREALMKAEQVKEVRPDEEKVVLEARKVRRPTNSRRASWWRGDAGADDAFEDRAGLRGCGGVTSKTGFVLLVQRLGRGKGIPSGVERYRGPGRRELHAPPQRDSEPLVRDGVRVGAIIRVNLLWEDGVDAIKRLADGGR